MIAADNVHTPPKGANPALQIQAEAADCPVRPAVLELSVQFEHSPASVIPELVEYVSAAQSKQAERPDTLEYLPAMQSKHAEVVEVIENLPLSQGRQKE